MKEELLIRASELYYQQNLSQNEIAEFFSISRPTVSRLLDEAKETGIVEIIIHSPINKNIQLSKKVRQTFNLKDAVVLKGNYLYEEALQKCSVIASQYVHSILGNNMSIGISWGFPMNCFAEALEKKEYYNVNVVQMVGCLGTGNPNLDGLELAIKISEKLKGTYSNIYAPVFVDSAVVQRYFLAEHQIENTIRKAQKTDIIITGVGSLFDDTSSLQTTGYICEEERQNLLAKGAVGHMLSRMIDMEGNEIPLDHKYVISASLDCLKQSRWSICISAHPKKTKPLYAALTSSYINIPIIDESLAQSLLDLHATRINNKVAP
ncbi:MAG: sugar-binding transcriptional regulator [Eubacteriales bacterium]